MLFATLRGPSAECRHAAFDVLRAAAAQRGGGGDGSDGAWGLRLLFSHDGFLEYLCLRATESTKLGKEWKFSVIEATAAPRAPGGGVDAAATAVLGEGVAAQLHRLLVQGPFYVPASALGDVDTVG